MQTNKAIIFFSSLSLVATSCTLDNSAAKKVVQEITEQFGESSTTQILKSGGRKLAAKEFFDELSKDFPNLARSVKFLDEGLAQKLADAMQQDEALVSLLSQRPSLLDEFIIFTKDSPEASKDFKLFHLFLNIKKSPSTSFLSGLSVRTKGTWIEFVKGQRIVAKYRDGVVELSESLVQNQGLAHNSLLHAETLPDVLYKISPNSTTGQSLLLRTDDMGRMKQLTLEGVSLSELNELALRKGAVPYLEEGDLSRLAQQLGDKRGDYVLNYHYSGTDRQPSRLSIKATQDGVVVFNQSLATIDKTLAEAYLALSNCYNRSGYLKGFKPSDLLVKQEGDNFILKHKLFKVTQAELQGDVIRAKSGSTIKNGELNQFLNSLIPQKTYIVDDVFEYKTDYLGRVVSVKGEHSRAYALLMEKGKRDSKVQKKVVKKMGGTLGNGNDDAGHLIANATRGGNEMINQVPMPSESNRHGAWRDMEREVEKALKDGKQVYSERKLFYQGDELRPYRIETKTVIDGKETSRVFQN